MASCIIKNFEYQKLKEASGISDFSLDVQVLNHQEKFERLPYLDELVGANSEPHLRKNVLGINKNNTIQTSKLLEITGKDSVEESIHFLNNTYRDLEISALPLNNEAVLDIKKRPDGFLKKIEQKPQIAKNSSIVFNDITDKLMKVYGIQINTITSAAIARHPDLRTRVHPYNAKGFIYNGEIYINTDIATIDTPVHELLHILMGSMKFSNPEMYYKLISTAQGFNNLEELSKEYESMSMPDLLEEAFIGELAKALTNQDNQLDILEAKDLNEIIYHVDRSLDSILSGDYTVKTVAERYSMTIKELSRLTNSDLLNTFNGGTMSAAHIHRIMANTKQNLIRKGDLQEKCE